MIYDVKLKSWIIIGIAIFFIGFFCSRLRTLLLPPRFNSSLTEYMQPVTDAQKLWRLRDFASIGFHSNTNRSLPAGIINQTYPQLSNYSYYQIIKFSGNTIDSLDLIMNYSDGINLLTKIVGRQPTINTSTPFEAFGKRWVAAIFDSEAALRANGYYDESVIGDDSVVWIQLSLIKARV